MTHEPSISDALYALGIGGGWTIRKGKIVKWIADKPQPSDKAIQDKLTELKKEYSDNKYQRDRIYPSIGEQLDLQYWDKKNGTKKWEEAIDKVKADNPKPE